MEPTDPVESDIGVATVELDGSTERLASGGLTESEQVVGHADPVGFQWVTLAVVVVADARLVEVAHASLLRVGSRWERRATMLSSITENPNRSLFSLFFKSRTSDKGKLPPMISTKMNADSFGSEMESESDLEERGFGGVGIIDEV